MKGNNKLSPLLYRYDVDENTAEVQTDVGHHICANGLVWSQDGTKFYYTDSATGHIREYNYDIETSKVKGPAREVLHQKNVGFGLFDGATLDTEGYLWWAFFLGNAVLRIDPKTGEVVKRINLKFRAPSSVVFGGEDFKTLLVTSCSNPLIPGLATGINGGIALITFTDEENIQGMPFNKAIL